MGVASLVLGIVALVFTFIPFLQGWGLILGIIGIVLGALGRKKGMGGTATAGLVCSIIATVLCGIVYLACYAFVETAESVFEEAARVSIGSL